MVGRSLIRRPLIFMLGLLLFSVFGLSGCGIYVSQAAPELGIYDDTDDVAYLAQYGTWIEVEPYGEVWQPYVSVGWRPFAYGHWMWADPDWAWVSYEPYGWLVYHYGNWGFEPEIGWFWVDGSDWSPAQVLWINYDDYTCWAPIPPPGLEWSEPWEQSRFDAWNVVATRDLDRDNIIDYRIARPPGVESSEHPNIVRGPAERGRIEKMTGRRMRPEKWRDQNVPVYMSPRAPREPEQGQPPTRGMGNRMRQAPGSEAGRIQLHRMILPKDEMQRVERYRPEVEKRVLVPKNKSDESRRGGRESGKER